MAEILKRLLSPEYLVVPDPGPVGSVWMVYAGLGLVFTAGLIWAVRVLSGRRKQAQPVTADRSWAWPAFWVCLAGLCTLIGRFAGQPGWSARIWPYSFALLAGAGALAYWFREVRLPRWLGEQLHILALAPSLGRSQARHEGSGAWLWPFLGLAAHVAGLALVATARFGLHVWIAPVVLAGILAIQLPLIAKRRAPRMMALSPLFVAYASTLLSVIYRWQQITVIEWQGLAFPNPMVSAFYLDGILLAAIAYTFLAQLAVTADALGKHHLLWRGSVLGLLLCVSLWAGVVYFGKQTHGAAGSDPYAYAQMAVDLADQGTLLHRYELFPRVAPLGIAWAPVQAVGYHIPVNALGDSASVWATGASFFLAAGYKLLGEVGLYATTPLLSFLALAATFALVQEVLHRETRGVRYVSGALAVALTATSPETVDRLLVPMADAPAQLFTVATLLFALRALRRLETGRRAWLDLALTGLCFAIAYWIRHTQLVLAFSIVLAVALGCRSRERPARLAAGSLLIVFGVALVAALPDISYRWSVFGSPLATETTELPHMRLEYIGPMAIEVMRNALVAGEWGYLFPLALYGGYRLARNHPRESAVIASAIGAVLIVHLTYRFLRLRDLISIFPLVNLAVAYGATALARWAQATASKLDKPIRLGTGLLPVIVMSWVIFSLALSRWAMIDDLWKPGWASFGYMDHAERQAFRRLEELTPEESVIAASLNAGAVSLYANRDAVRPYDGWDGEAWAVFVEAMRADGRPVYLLDDGARMAAFIEGIEADYELERVEALTVPLYEATGWEDGWLYRLELAP